MTHFRDFIKTFFHLLSERGIKYLVLRNYEDLPDKTTNDVDILIEPTSLKAASQVILDSALETGWTLSNVGRFSCLSLFFFRPDTLEQTHIDLMYGNRWHSLVFADDRKMLASRVPFKCFYKPSPVDEAWVSLSTRLLYNGYVKQKYRPQIQSACLEYPDAAQEVFGLFLGKGFAGKMVSLCTRGQWNCVERLKRKARLRVFMHNLRHPLALASRLSSDVFRLMSRIRFPPGLVIGIVGANDEWRNVIAETLMQDLKGTFYSEKTFRGQSSTTADGIWRKVRKNAFRGGLFVIDFPVPTGLEKRCDLLFADGTCSVPGSVVPPSTKDIGRFVITTVLQFLANRTRNTK